MATSPPLRQSVMEIKLTFVRSQNVKPEKRTSQQYSLLIGSEKSENKMNSMEIRKI